MILVKGLQRYQRSKLEVEKNICQLSWPWALGFELGRFSDLQLWSLIPLQPLDQNQCLVPHLKDLFHICLKLENQGHSMTFRICNLGSKQPHLYSAYVVSVAFQLYTTVSLRGTTIIPLRNWRLANISSFSWFMRFSNLADQKILKLPPKKGTKYF